jgi:hypothetical protein
VYIHFILIRLGVFRGNGRYAAGDWFEFCRVLVSEEISDLAVYSQC